MSRPHLTHFSLSFGSIHCETITTLKPVIRIEHAVSGHRNPAGRTVKVLDDDLTHRRRRRLEAFDDGVDAVVAEIGDEVRLPVVQRPLWAKKTRHRARAVLFEQNEDRAQDGYP